MSQPVSFYEAVGGEETFTRLVHRFYQGVATDPVLRPVYPAQDLGPAEVAAELRRAAFAIAGRFEGVTGDQWQRTGARSDGARFTVETFARYFIHDPVHHLYDVTGTRPDG